MAAPADTDTSLASLGLTPEVWVRLSPLLDAALEVPVDRRAAWMAGLGPEHADLLPRLQPLLLQQAPPLLTLPALEDAADDHWQSGDRVGPYLLEVPLGEGGMGTVWRARREDGLLQRPVALKLPRLEGRTRRGLAERLARERDLLATLAHPHIAHLLDAGLTVEGQPYLALEWVDGERIDQWCARHALDVTGRVRLFLQVAHAVAHAHARLIVHRDLKPSNVLVDATGQVKLLDFGIAKLLEPGRATDSTLTREHARPMTPDYASPEQLVGDAVDTRSDIYAIGVMLYELLSGQRPYRIAGMGPHALAQAVLQQEPVPPSHAAGSAAWRRLLRGDLDTIVLKALKKAPEQRYATVEALAEDLQRHLDGRPVLARPDSLGYVLRRLVGRHRVAVAALAAAVVAVLVGAGAATWQAQRARLEQQRADEVKDFVARLLRDASPFRPAATSWRVLRMVSRGLNDSAAESARDAAGVTALTVLRQAAAQLDRGSFSDGAVRAELQRVVGEGLLSFGAWAESGRRLSGALTDARASLGDTHPQTLRLRLALVQHGRVSGRMREAGDELAAVLSLLRARRDTLAEPLAQALQLQALLLLDAIQAGRGGNLVELQQAAALVDEAGDVVARLPPSHLEQVSHALLRSLVQRLAGRADEARRHARRALAALPDPASGPAPGALAALRVEALHLSARAETELGDHTAALQALTQAAQEVRPLMGADRLPLALLLHAGQAVALDLRDLATAGMLADQLAELVAGAGRSQAFVMALTDSARGALLLARAQPSAALPALESSLAHLVDALGPQHELAVKTQVHRLRALARLDLIDRGRQAVLGWPDPAGDAPERQRLRLTLQQAAEPFR